MYEKRKLLTVIFFLLVCACIVQRVFRALYDYEAQDTDEVSFSEGDLIFEVDSIDAGWMTGRVERTGMTGMLPANYVESI